MSLALNLTPATDMRSPVYQLAASPPPPHKQTLGLTHRSNFDGSQHEAWSRSSIIGIPEVLMWDSERLVQPIQYRSHVMVPNADGASRNDDSLHIPPPSPLIPCRAQNHAADGQSDAGCKSTVGLGIFFDNDREVTLPTFPDWSSSDPISAFADIEDTLNSMCVDYPVDDTFASMHGSAAADTTLVHSEADTSVDTLVEKLAMLNANDVGSTLAAPNDHGSYSPVHGSLIDVSSSISGINGAPRTPCRWPSQDVPNALNRLALVPGTPYPPRWMDLADMDSDTLEAPGAPHLPSEPFPPSQQTVCHDASTNKDGPARRVHLSEVVSIPPPASSALNMLFLPVPTSWSAGTFPPPAAPTKKRHRREMSDLADAMVPPRRALGIVQPNAQLFKIRYERSTN